MKERLAEAKQSLRAEQIPFDEKIPLGIMLEVPSVMFIIDQCCEEVDFFSIGSNDLTQYLLAVDRDNAKVTRHYNSLNPAFLRALDYAVQAVHRQGKWIGLCGELGAKGSVLPLLVGLGLDELSMSAPAIPATKSRLAQLDSRACRQLLNQAVQCRTSLEVEHLLAQFRMRQQDVPLVSAECITLNSDWRSKEEVLKGMTDNLLLAGRCRYPRKLEADLWAREAVFSTGLGFSFAIPHSKSEHIEQSTISVARLAQPVIWGDEEAQFVIMLTLNKHSAGDQHMRIFSRAGAAHYARGVPSISGLRGEQRGYCRPAAPRAGTVICTPASTAGRCALTNPAPGGRLWRASSRSAYSAGWLSLPRCNTDRGGPLPLPESSFRRCRTPFAAQAFHLRRFVILNQPAKWSRPAVR